MGEALDVIIGWERVRHLRWACARPRLLGVCLGRAVGCFSLASTGFVFEEF